MRTIIAGSRNSDDYEIVKEAIASAGWLPTVVISGGAKGVDALGEKWAEDNGIPVERFKPDWKQFGRGAGPVRNRQMAENAEALIALWDGQSRGTGDMIAIAKEVGLKVFVYDIELEGE